MAVGLTLGGQSFDLAGFAEHDDSLGRLWGAATARGSTRLIPHVDGRRAYPMRPDEVTVDLQLEVYGEKDNTGAAHVDEFTGLSANLLWLRDFVVATWDGTNATVAASLETVGGSAYTADVQILNWQVVRYAPTVAYVAYDLRIPGGVWTTSP